MILIIDFKITAKHKCAYTVIMVPPLNIQVQILRYDFSTKQYICTRYFPFQKFQEIWDIMDENHDGALDYGEFTRNFIGEMNEKRKALVLKVLPIIDHQIPGLHYSPNIAMLC